MWLFTGITCMGQMSIFLKCSFDKRLPPTPPLCFRRRVTMETTGTTVRFPSTWPRRRRLVTVAGGRGQRPPLPPQLIVELVWCTQVVFEALKKGGLRNDIALDDIQLTSEPCGPAPPDPTKVPPPTTTPPIPRTVAMLHKPETDYSAHCCFRCLCYNIWPLFGTADCGGPFDLWEPNTTFSSPNYPNAYGHNAECEQHWPDIYFQTHFFTCGPWL